MGREAQCRGTDRHTSDVGHWCGNDTLQEMQRIMGDGVRAPRPTEGNKGAAERADVGSELSAASGG